MKNLSTQEFCDMFNACPRGREFAKNYATMRECYEALLNGEAGEESAEWAIWVFSREGATSEKNQRLFAIACARRIQHLMTDERSIRALDVTERYANSEATDSEFSEVFVPAQMAAYEAAPKASSAAYVAAMVVKDCGWTEACVAVASGGRDSERKAQLEILKTYGNIFEDEEVNAEVKK